MTVAEAGRHDGVLLTRVSEADLDTDEPVIELSAASGRINPDLTVGVDVTRARALKASAGISSPGVKLHGAGFIITHGQALALGRYIVTVETAKHRVFRFLDETILPDNKLIAFALDDAADLAILSSRAHEAWYLANAGKLAVYDRDAVYVKSRCFDPFPFPPRDEAFRDRLREAGEALDAHRRAVLADNPDLTLTTLYNCLEQVRAGATLDDKSEAVKQRGLVIVLRDLHDAIDRLTLEAYGWPAETGDADIVARLVALNQERAQEEATGHVRWLRPAYQGPRAGVAAPQTRVLTLVSGEAPAQRRPRFPSDRYEQPLAVQAALETSGPAASADLARRFSGGAGLEPRISRILTTLHRYGHVDRLPDGRWTASRAA
jgi:hypothetical protein